jgi:hypothetical protein
MAVHAPAKLIIAEGIETPRQLFPLVMLVGRSLVIADDPDILIRLKRS